MQIPSQSFRCEHRAGDFVIQSMSERRANLGGTTDSSIRPNGMNAFLFSYFICRAADSCRSQEGEKRHDSYYITGWLGADF